MRTSLILAAVLVLTGVTTSAADTLQFAPTQNRTLSNGVVVLEGTPGNITGGGTSSGQVNVVWSAGIVPNGGVTTSSAFLTEFNVNLSDLRAIVVPTFTVNTSAAGVGGGGGVVSGGDPGITSGDPGIRGGAVGLFGPGVGLAGPDPGVRGGSPGVLGGPVGIGGGSPGVFGGDPRIFLPGRQP
jgi:hypothetical protein